jgi:hypothetical protein
MLFQFLLMWSLCLAVAAHDFSWRRLHACADPDTLRRTVREYRQKFPCEECRVHFDALVEHHPFPIAWVRTHQDVRVWTWLTHNLVNRRLGAPWQSWDIMNTDL